MTNPKPFITAFKTSPDRGRGLARDMRVRWALEEVGQTYDVRLVTFAEMKEPSYKRLQPFGQIPAYQEGDLVLFESGAIVLYVAEKNSLILPSESPARARAIAWMFSALNTVEPPIFERSLFHIIEKDKSWYQERAALLDEQVHKRLKDLSNHLANSEWLDGAFSAGDLLMVTVLRRLDGTGLLKPYVNLNSYVERAVARPAYRRAFEAQLAVFKSAQT